MVLGYDERRPSRENYSSFLEKLCKGLDPLGSEGVSLMLYGSYVRGDNNPGRSDIDAVLVFPQDVAIDKNQLKYASNVLATANEGNNIPFQVTVTDLRTMQEGTFNSFGPDFKPYFETEKRVVVGKDYTDTFTYSMPENPDQIPLRFNLRKSRLGLLFSEFDRKKDYKELLKKFNKTLDSASRASKQILHMVDGSLRKNRFSALNELSRFFPNVDPRPLIKIRELYTDLEKLDALYRNPGELMQVWNDSVTFFESMIKAYLDKKAT